MGESKRLFAALQDARGRPTGVVFQVTNRCNYDCGHCFQERTDREELSLEEIDRVLGELASFGVMFLTLMGGEFFMRRDADEILKLARQHGFAIKVLTTGHHISEARAELIASLKPIQVDLSLYSASHAVHEAVTNAAGSWKRTMDAARRLVERGVTVCLKTPVMEANASTVAEIADIAREIGAQFTFDPFLTGREDGDQSPTMMRASDDSLRQFFQDESTGTWAVLKGHAAERDATSLEGAPCGAAKRVAAIGPEGLVYPCNSLPVECGDLRTQTFEEVWTSSEAMAQVRGTSWANIDDCNRCDVRKHCRRCHAMALLEDGSMRGPSLEACRQAVLVRDLLRDRGLLPATDTALPPTWDRLQLERVERVERDLHRDNAGIRPAALRVLP